VSVLERHIRGLVCIDTCVTYITMSRMMPWQSLSTDVASAALPTRQLPSTPSRHHVLNSLHSRSATLSASHWSISIPESPCPTRRAQVSVRLRAILESAPFSSHFRSALANSVMRTASNYLNAHAPTKSLQHKQSKPSPTRALPSPSKQPRSRSPPYLCSTPCLPVPSSTPAQQKHKQLNINFNYTMARSSPPVLRRQHRQRSPPDSAQVPAG